MKRSLLYSNHFHGHGCIAKTGVSSPQPKNNSNHGITASRNSAVALSNVAKRRMAFRTGQFESQAI